MPRAATLMARSADPRRGAAYTRSSRACRPLAVPPPPPAQLRGRRRTGARRAHAAQCRGAGQGPPRLSLRGLAGTGKTSMAKILAACLNCEQGPTVEPCGRCESCTAIAAATSLDVIEMDAASNNLSTTSATCARASPSPRSPGATRSTSSTRPTCSRRRRGTPSSRRSRSRRRTRSSCWRRRRPRRSCRPSSTAVTASTSRARPPSSSRPWCGASPTRRRSTSPPTRSRCWPATRRARSATRSARSSSSSPTAVAASRPRTSSPCSAWPRRTCCSGRSRRLSRATRRRRCARPRPSPRPGATSHRSRATSRRTRDLLVVQALGEVPAELRLTPERDLAPGRAGARATRSELTRLLDLLAVAMRAVKDGADLAYAPRAGARRSGEPGGGPAQAR